MLLENYCDECDEVVHAVFNDDDFINHRIGTIRCPVCGSTILPCNECENHDMCSECPWDNVPPEDAMSDEAYMRYIRAYEPWLYEKFVNGEMGNHYDDIIKKIEKKSN
jgi:hypothetical protein